MNSIRIYPPNGYSGQRYRFDFTDENIVSGSMSCERSMMFDTLTPYEFTAEVICDELGSSKLMTSDSKWYHTVNNEGYVIGYQDIRNCVYGSSVEVSFNNRWIEDLYLQSIERLSVDHFRIKAFSAVGLWTNIQHFGGIYNGETAGDVISDILQGTGTYYIDNDVAAVPIYGYLPIASVRDNLQQVLFAIGAFCGTNYAHFPYFYFPSTSSPDRIYKTQIYIGGRLNNLPHATSVRVTEHSYYASNLDVEVSLFDNTDGSGTANNKLVTFSEPCHDLKWNGSAISGSWDSGANYCYVTGTGVLTGKKYTHTTKIFSVPTASTGQKNEAKIEKATLVSPVNSANVAARVADYKGNADEVAYGIDCPTLLYGVGWYIRFSDPYGEEVTGYIEAANYTMSGKTKADCRIIKNYIPSNYGNNFTSYQLFTSNGTYTASKTGLIRIVLCQGGQGGDGGVSGGDGSISPMYVGTGGAGGNGGAAGKIYVADINVTAGQTFSYTIGAGGAGGTGGYRSTVSPYDHIAPTAGSEGTHSTFGTYTSANGSSPANGYVNILTGIVYAENGQAGINGANGGERNQYGESVTYGNTTWTGGKPYTMSGNYPAGGGGAAYGSNGGDAYGGTRPHGGNGATALQLSETLSRGSGGAGGNGGGGGGIGGSNSSIDWGTSGHGGDGSNGNNGANGFIIVFE